VADELVAEVDIFITAGTIGDGSCGSNFATMLVDGGYDFSFVQTNEGHSWSNWRALLVRRKLRAYPKSPSPAFGGGPCLWQHGGEGFFGFWDRLLVPYNHPRDTFYRGVIPPTLARSSGVVCQTDTLVQLGDFAVPHRQTQYSFQTRSSSNEATNSRLNICV
jgi:hypothetical protein